MHDPTQPPPWTPPPRKRHTARNVILICAGALAVIIIAAGAIGAAVGSGKTPPTATGATVATTAATATDPNGQNCLSLDSQGYCPGDDPTPAPTTPPSPTTVTFIVTGTGQPDITYGSDSDHRDGGGNLGDLGQGNGLPWRASIPFDPNAQYYSIDAQLQGGGDITCKIVVTGPGWVPLVVSRGHASGSYNICSAQAAPSDSSGTSWQNEG